MTPAALATRIPLIDADESNLASRLMHREPDAFDQLVVLYQRRVARLASRLLGWNDAQDVVQEVFLAAFEKAHRFRGDCSLWTWLTIITLNACRSRLRRQATFNRILALIPSYRNSPSATEPVELDETCRRVRAVVSRLPGKERELIVLRHLEDRSTAEIASMLNRSTNTIEVRLHRARQKLKAMLSQTYEDSKHGR